MSLLLVALLVQNSLAAPDVRTIEAAISRPRLDHCDEISCYYRPGRNLVVRAVVCDPATASGAVVCSYERTELSPVRVICPGDTPAPENRSWSPARTEFRSAGTDWFIVSDSDD